MKNAAPHIVIGYNASRSVWVFRAQLIRTFLDKGYSVSVLAPYDDHTQRLIDMGAKYIEVPMEMNRNPVADLILLARFLSAIRKLNPSIYLGYTAKPNIYGSLAAQIAGVPTVNNIAGLGSNFITEGVTTRILKRLYRLALRRSARVFFQNSDDRELFLREAIVHPDADIDLLPGSGVDLEKFTPVPLPEGRDGRLRFLFVGRMLWSKGVMEFYEAARQLKPHYPEAEFRLMGDTNAKSPTAVSIQQIEAWEKEGTITYQAFQEDIRPEIATADCVVLPSYYREGVPRSLLEAASMARPIITTDAVGCRDAVDDGISGYLCEARNTRDLADKMQKMLSLSRDEREAMGQAGRRKMVAQFDERIVINKYLAAIQELARNCENTTQ